MLPPHVDTDTNTPAHDLLEESQRSGGPREQKIAKSPVSSSSSAGCSSGARPPLNPIKADLCMLLGSLFGLLETCKLPRGLFVP